MTRGTTLATIRSAMNIDARGSNPDQPVNLIRIVETITPTLPKVSYLISSIWRNENPTHGQDVKEHSAHIVRVGVIVPVRVFVGLGMIVVMVVRMVVEVRVSMCMFAVLVSVMVVGVAVFVMSMPVLSLVRLGVRMRMAVICPIMNCG